MVDVVTTPANRLGLHSNMTRVYANTFCELGHSFHVPSIVADSLPSCYAPRA